MAVVIRLRRMGAKKDPKYRIVVAESKSPRDGRFIAELGHYNPQPKVAECRIDAERARYWLSVGARPSDQVRSLLKKAGISVPVAPTRSRRKAEGAAAKPRVKRTGPPKRVLAKKARVERKASAPKPKKKAAKKDAKKS